MNLQLILLAAIIGYLFGSISFARIINKLVAPDVEITGIELDDIQVDAISGTAVSMKLGAKYGGLTAILDILKVAIPALVLRLVYKGDPYYLISAAMGLVGHNWPLYYRFKGGRGLSAIYGGFFVMDWIGSLVISFAGMLFGLLIVKDVAVSYMAGLWLMIPWIWFRTHDVAHLAYVIFVNVIFFVAMIPEIRKMKELRRNRESSSVSAGMDAIPMGRMIKKMANRVGMLKDEA
jgi:glycerol-3-phosphate acyltransferase PlsY